MARGKRRSDWGLRVLAVLIAGLLWVVAHGSSSVEKGFDVPVAFHGVPETLVITDQNSDVVNVRVKGSRAALRNLELENQEYPVDVSSARAGESDFEVDVSAISLPRGAEIVSRSPSRIEVKFEARGTKVMRVRADVEGEPAEGFALAAVEVDPPRVRVTGARREVLRLSEVVTEPIDVTGVSETTVRQVRLSVGGRHVWVEDGGPVTVRIQVTPEAADESGRTGQTSAPSGKNAKPKKAGEKRS